MTANQDSPPEIAPGIFWVGTADMEGGLHCNPYLLVDHDEAVLIDPGNVLDFEMVKQRIEQLVPLERISHVVLHHQDPDLCASVPLFEEVGLKARMVTHWRAAVLHVYYGIKSEYYLVNEHDFRLQLASGRTLQFILAPYLHFPGSIMTYDETSRVLFSGDLFGAFSLEWQLYAREDYLEAMKLFHENYMPGNDILRPVMEILMDLDIGIIAPQHGSIITEHPRNYIAALRDLECGAFLHPIKKELSKSGGYLGICNQILKRYYSVFGVEEVRAIFEKSSIKLDPETHLIADFDSTGRELWDDLFQIVYSQKGLSWISVIESLVNRHVEEYDVEYPAIFKSVMFDIDKKAEELSEENRRLRELNQRLEENLRTTESKLTRCPVTDLYNQIFFRQYLVDELDAAAMRKDGAALIQFEVDNLSAIHYEYGEQKGHEVLKGVASLLLQERAGNHALFRLEGAAFAYYAAGVDRDQAHSLAEKIRDTLIQAEIFIIPVEVSFGVAHLDEFAAADESGSKLASMFAGVAGMRAALARKLGKNQICTESSLEEQAQAFGRILVVDTDDVNVDVLKTALEAMEFEVQTCSDGQQALDTISVTPPDLIIAELMVPKIDGLAVRQQLLDKPHGASIPFILLSHQKTVELVERALSLNIEHVIKKPYLLSEVVGIVRHKLTVTSE